MVLYLVRRSKIFVSVATLYLGPGSSVDDDSNVKAHILKGALDVLRPEVESAREHRHLDGRLIS